MGCRACTHKFLYVRIIDVRILVTPADTVKCSYNSILSFVTWDLFFFTISRERFKCMISVQMHARDIGCKCFWALRIRHARRHCDNLASIHLLLFANYGPLFAYLHPGERKV